jgi:hypothetical protein
MIPSLPDYRAVFNEIDCLMSAERVRVEGQEGEKNKPVVLAGNANLPLCEKVFSLLGVSAVNALTIFKTDCEIAPEIDGRFPSVLSDRGVFVFQGADPYVEGGLQRSSYQRHASFICRRQP